MCFGDKKEDEDEEGLYTDSDRGNDDEMNNMEAGVLSPLDDDDLPPAVDDLPPNDIPEVVVMMSAYEPERKSKRKQFKSMFKKKKKKATENGNARFDASAFEPESKSKIKQFKSMFKKKKKKATENGNVRFDASSSETTSLVSESPQSSNYSSSAEECSQSDLELFQYLKHWYPDLSVESDD